jgi:DHA1 family florfenicol/chloramphenicol resistance protein-like MFS transporter
MIITTRFARQFVAKWGILGSLARGMGMLLLGAALLSIGQIFGSASFFTFIVPMWVTAIGIVFAVSVAANGALKGFDDIAGSAVALYFCIQSLITGILGTLAVITLQGDTAWPLVAYSSIMAIVVLAALAMLRSRTMQE